MPNKKLEEFFDKMETQGLRLTYDDVRLQTNHSDMLPSQTDVSTRFSKRITLKIPIAASPMDTVTESSMAIAMAEAGGIGIIHRGLSPEAQAKEVGRVKYRLNGLIKTPITVHDNETVAAVLAMVAEKKYPFHSFPVLNQNGIVVGVLSGSDIEFCDDYSQTVAAVMTPREELTTASPGTDVQEAYRILRSTKKKKLPLLHPDDSSAGMYLFSDVKRIVRGGSSYNADDNGQLLVAAAVGVREGARQRAVLLAAHGCDAFVIDTAHGDSGNVIETIKSLKAQYPDIDVIAGNVSAGESARRLADAGADGVLIGQGPGSICTTRVIAGVGTPQVSAVYECVRALEGSGVPVIADGGIRSSGDIAIALAIGASSVVLGSLLAGTNESPGETRLLNGVQVKDYRGMGSHGAMRDNASSRERYKQGVPEGVEGIVAYKGPVHTALDQYVGGVRSSMGYLGAKTLEEFRERARIFRMTQAAAVESHPHDITITADSPNYSRRN